MCSEPSTIQQKKTTITTRHEQHKRNDGKKISKKKKNFFKFSFYPSFIVRISNGIFKYFIHKCEFIACMLSTSSKTIEPWFHGSCNILYTFCYTFLLNATCKQKGRETIILPIRNAHSYSHAQECERSRSRFACLLCQWHMYLAFHNMSTSSCRQLHITNHR